MSLDRITKRRAAVYAALGAGLLTAAAILDRVEWIGTSQLHTVLEAVAMMVALIVGLVALVRYYSKKETVLLVVGAAFLGAGLLDGHHMLLTASFSPQDAERLVQNSAGAAGVLLPWSWNPSRTFLSVLLVLAWWVSTFDARHKSGRHINEALLFVLIGLTTLLCVALFAIVPLRTAYHVHSVLGRPAELVPTIFCVAALGGFLRLGAWRREPFEHWLILSLLFSTVAQGVCMSRSFALFDTMFFASHVLKIAGYACVLAGLLSSMYAIFVQADRNHEQLCQITEALDREVAMRRTAEERFCAANESLEERVRERTKDLDALRLASLNIAEDAQNAQRETLEAKRHLRQSLQAAKAGTWSWDSQKNRCRWDERTLELHGGAPGTHASSWETWFSLVDEEDRAAFKEAVHNAVERGEPFDVAYRLRRAAGNGRYIRVQSEVVRNESGAAAYMSGVCIDVTESRRTELSLLASEERLSRAVRHAPFPAVIHAEDGEILHVSESWTQLSGYTREEIPTIAVWTEKAYGPRCHDVRRFIATLYARKEPVNAGEFVIITKSGERRTWEFRATPLGRMQDGRRLVIGMAADVTERKKNEEILKRTADALLRSNQELEKFAYAASHDLQEPLRLITSYSQLLARRYRGKLDQDADEFIHYMVDGVERMRGLINGLLHYARIGKQETQPKPVDCNTVLQHALTNLKIAMDETGAQVTFDPLPILMGDETELEQLFQNLLSNAVKYHRDEPPHVHVSATRKGSAWQFSVRDNGIGIDPQYADKVFVIFQRLHSRQEYPGTGIGLAACKKIVEHAGGHIWFESTPGQGTTFFFTFPAVEGIPQNDDACLQTATA